MLDAPCSSSCHQGWAVQVAMGDEPEQPMADWLALSQAVGTRSPKQCRDRWHAHLAPSMVEQGVPAD